MHWGTRQDAPVLVRNAKIHFRLYKLFLIVQTGFPYTTLGPVAGLQANDQVIMPADSAWGMQPSDGTVYAQPVRTSSEEQGEVVILLLLLPVFSLFVFAFRPYLSTNLLVSGRMQLADQIMREGNFPADCQAWSCMSCFRCLSGLTLASFPETVANLLPSGHTWQLLILFTVWPCCIGSDFW